MELSPASPGAGPAGGGTGPVISAGLAAAYPQALVVAGIATVLLEFPGPRERASAEQVTAVLAELVTEASSQPATAATHTIPVTYDGADLAQVAAALGLGVGDLVARHTTAGWTVAAVGFAPGFGYLTCDDPLFAAIPRRPDPRLVVPAGAVAVAAGMSAVYPGPSPGGWQLLGSTAVTMFHPDRERPARLSVGDRVRFVAVDRDTGPVPGEPVTARPVTALAPRRSGGLARPGTAAATGAGRGHVAGQVLAVTDVAGLALGCDLGRRALVPSGVPRGGPFDEVAHTTAQRLLANPGHAAGLELAGSITLELVGGPALPVCACGEAQTWIDGVPMPTWTVLELPAGVPWTVRTRRGRCTIAVSGGLAWRPVLGSRSTCTLGMLGPPPVAAGDVLPVGEVPAAALALHATSGSLVGSHARPPRAHGPIPFLPGPHVPLERVRARVVRASRVGLRLAPTGVGDLPAHASLPSLGVLPGTIQVLPSGELVVLGPDAGTMGGYPVAGAVASGALWRLSGLVEGDQVELAPVDERVGVPAVPCPTVVRPLS